MASESNASSSPNGEESFRADALLPATVDFESLRRYASAKLSIAHQLRSFLDLLKKRGDESRVQSCEGLMAKLAEDRFTIAVLGQFKRGKSSLLNAIIGRNLLPTGILPLTTVITVIRFGTRERLVTYRKGRQFPQDESIAALSDYVTAQHNPENQKGIETVAIELPLPYLRRGLQFVDTPGVGSALKANTETTYSFLPNCDAVLFVTGADGPLSEATAPVRVGAPSDYTTRGCPVCDRLVSLSKEFFVKFQYALYNDEREQEAFAESGGFCPFHTWQLEAISSPVGFSVGCARLVRRFAGLLAQAASSADCGNSGFPPLFPELKSCRVCGLLREAEQRQIEALSASLQKAATKELYARSQGVCLPHLEMIVQANSNSETNRFLLQTAATVLQLVSEDMEGFALKREATRRHLVSEDEGDAYLRAVIHLAGARRNCAPWAYRDEI